MTLLQTTNYAVDVTVAGITIVFGMLILLVAIISIFGKFMSGTVKEKKVKVEKPVAKQPVAVAAKPVVAASEDDELIAVISAAVYSMYEGTGVKPVIKAIRPSVGRNTWGMAGINQNMKSFF